MAVLNAVTAASSSTASRSSRSCSDSLMEEMTYLGSCARQNLGAAFATALGRHTGLFEFPRLFREHKSAYIAREQRISPAHRR
jgi:hypothetical protein